MPKSKPLRVLVLLVCCGLICMTGAVGGYYVKREMAYKRVEGLTALYGREFESVVEQVRLSQYSNRAEIRYFKVFEYSKSASKLFVVFHEESTGVGTGDTGGVFVFLERDPGHTWEVAEPIHVVWSFYGSADGRTWPPYGPVDPFADCCGER